MTRLGLAIAAFFIVGLAPLVALAFVALGQLDADERVEIEKREREASAQLDAIHKEYAERCRGLIVRETRREFTEFQYWHAPVGQAYSAPTVSRSALADLPRDPFVRAYFQVAVDLTRADAGARYSSPHTAFEDQQFAAQQAAQKVADGRDPEAVALGNFRALEGVIRDLVAGAPAQASAVAFPIGQSATDAIQADAPSRGGRFLDVDPTLARRALSAAAPLEEREVPNEVLAMNSDWGNVLMVNRAAQESRKGRISPKEDPWENLRYPEALRDPAGASRVAVYPYAAYRRSGQHRETSILWRSVRTPIEHLLQGFEVDTEYIRGVWLPERLESAPLLTVAAAARDDDATPIHRSLNIEERAEDDTALLFAFPALGVTISSDMSGIARRYESLRRDYWIIGGSYLATFAGLALVLGGTLRRRAALLRQQGDFIAAVSHELRTPLSSIRLYAEMLEQSPEARNDAAVRRTVARILADEERLSRTLEMVLASSRIERGTMLVAADARAPLSIAIERALEDARRKYPDREIVWNAPSLPLVAMNEAAAVLLFWNLIDNALKYSALTDAPSDVSRKVSPPPVVIEARVVGERCEVEIVDHGIGISRADQSRVFERFFRGRRANEFGAGTGLGLWLSRVYAERMGWTLTLTSEEGRGTRARVGVPVL